jgi:D-threo-aldose 1-dehydrogenase
VRTSSELDIGCERGTLDGSATGLRLGFGCAALMRLPSRRGRQQILAEAFERGVRHFDVARMYGLGAAEGELGRFAGRRRDDVQIATKFGLDPSGPALRLARYQAPARAAIARLPALRAAVKRRGAALHEPRRYDGPAARRSLETSLRELRTDYVDFFFLHDPRPGDRVDVESVGETLEELRSAGRIRAWGLSGDPEPCTPLRDAFEVPLAMQLRDEIFDPAVARGEWDAAPITFGVIADALGRILAYVSSSEERRRRWARDVGVDCGQPSAVASLLLQDALDRNRDGMVLFSTTRPERIGAAVEAAGLAGEASHATLRSFRERVLTDLGGRRQERG